MQQATTLSPQNRNTNPPPQHIYGIINSMTQINTPYEDLLTDILENGEQKTDRTGTGTISVFGRQLRYNLQEAFPLITTKKVYFHGVIGELLWFLSGDTNITWLNDNNIHIWDEWADEKGNLGPIYSAQWRNWKGYHGGVIDQISHSLDLLKTNPDSRRNIVSAWNVGDLDNMALEPCHAMFQLYVSNGKLSIQVYQRSADMFLGVPFNIASYALLAHMFAQQADLEVGELIWTEETATSTTTTSTKSKNNSHVNRDHTPSSNSKKQKPCTPTPSTTFP